MKYRSKDVLSAAFEGDLPRLKLLAQSAAPGGLMDDDEWTEDHEAEVDNFVRHASPSLQALENRGEQEEEEEVSDADEVDQDKETLRNIAHKIIRRTAISKILNQQGKIQLGNSPVALKTYGISVTVKEKLQEDGTLGEGAVFDISWKPCERGPFLGNALHWAVLGRSHSCLAYLVLHNCSLSSGLSDKTQAGVSPIDLAKANKSFQVLHDMEEAVKKRDEELQAEEDAIVDIEVRMTGRIERLKQKRLEREQAERDEEREANAEEEEEEQD
ncbi:hypothetical protein ADEAN_001003900 [Angomonas deanei]|uniref:Uncharacterized protein n=1 Tax=Angomonas deanei TaxID=59799 RepID=A0A7G2CSF8_9TRYP|nr:hypothetical protein ADEAN_001003900 [Angomonas deanei]